MNIFEQIESEVRGYCRSFPVVFQTAKGAQLRDTEGKTYLDFFAGAGVLNYGHNPDPLKEKLLEYISGDNITHSLDMYSAAKQRFLETFNEVILKPRNMNYKVQFPGPTGTNAVEAALKLARKVTGRRNVIFFTNAFHGMTMGALAITGNAGKRAGAGVPLHYATPLPYDGYLGKDVDTLDVLEAYLKDAGSGVDKPAAAILETVQAEGGVKVARREWVERLQRICREHGMLLIVDDIQVGCGRTGNFFSFEGWDIDPDIICISKSLSGYGLPFAIDLIKPEHDKWKPGEHNGTFRGHNLAFVTAVAAIEHFWKDNKLSDHLGKLEEIATARLGEIAERFPALKLSVRGRGLIQGLVSAVPGAAGRMSQECFKRGLIIETAGVEDQVLKLLPPLVLSEDELRKGLDIIEQAAEATSRDSRAA
jgi:diaminobutyrate-2-oxoglutarate transaminase